MKRRVLVADCFPPDLLPELERNGLLGMGQAEVVMVNEFDAVLRDMRQDPSRFFFGNETSQGIKVP